MPDNLATKTTPEEKKRRKALNRQIRKEKRNKKNIGRKVNSPTDYPSEDWENELESQRMQERENQGSENINPIGTRISAGEQMPKGQVPKEISGNKEKSDKAEGKETEQEKEEATKKEKERRLKEVDEAFQRSGGKPLKPGTLSGMPAKAEGKETEQEKEERNWERRLNYLKKIRKDQAKKVVKKAAKKAAGQAAKAVGRSIWVYIIVPIAGFIVSTWYIWLILAIIIIIVVIIKEKPELIEDIINKTIWEYIKLKLKGEL